MGISFSTKNRRRGRISMSDSLKEEIIDNPRKIGSANLMYVQDLIEKYCD